MFKEFIFSPKQGRQIAPVDVCGVGEVKWVGRRAAD